MAKVMREWLLPAELRVELQRLLSGPAKASLSERVRIVLLSAEGRTAEEISFELGVVPLTVYKWRKRFLELGIEGLKDLPRPGQPRKITEEKREAILRVTREETPVDATRWSIRRVAAVAEASEYQVRSVWEEAGVAGHARQLMVLQHELRSAGPVLELRAVFMAPPHCFAVFGVSELQVHEQPRGAPRLLQKAEAVKVQRESSGSFFRAFESAQQRRSNHGNHISLGVELLGDVLRRRRHGESIHVVSCEHSLEFLDELGGLGGASIHALPSVVSLLSLLEDLARLIEVRTQVGTGGSEVSELRRALQSFANQPEVAPGCFSWCRADAVPPRVSDWREVHPEYRRPHKPQGLKSVTWHSCTSRPALNTARVVG